MKPSQTKWSPRTSCRKKSIFRQTGEVCALSLSPSQCRQKPVVQAGKAGLFPATRDVAGGPISTGLPAIYLKKPSLN